MFSALLRRVHNAIMGANVRYAVYPVIAAVDIAGVKLTCKTAKTMDADPVAIVTAGTSPQVEYWICSVLVHTVETAEIHGVRIETAAAVKLWELIFDPTAASVNLPPFDLPFPIKMGAKAVVNGVMGCVTASKTAYVALICATLL